MKNKLIHQIEEYVKDTFSKAEKNHDLIIAHDYKHVDRVRNWALRIAEKEHYQDLEIVEIAALLHDIGLPSVKKENRRAHGPAGAKIAHKFLKESASLSEDKLTEISQAIEYHSASPTTVAHFLKENGEEGKLTSIIRDADSMDAIGAVGLMRAFTSKSSLADYDPENIKGETWGLEPQDFDNGFSSGKGAGKYIIDQVNFQISVYNNLHTGTAQQLALPLVKYMKAFVIQLDSEIANNSKISGIL